jgi:hypothetical protein
MHSFKNPPIHIVPVTISPARSNKLFAANCRALADFLETTVNSSFNNASWFGDLHHCSTTGCCLGIAAMSHIIPGLQFVYIDNKGSVSDAITTRIVPTINGKRSDWTAAGKYFFGREAVDRVFLRSYLTKDHAVERLRDVASGYEAK